MSQSIRKFLSLIIFLSVITPLFSQFYVENGGVFTMGKSSNAPGLDSIFIFDNLEAVSPEATIFFKSASKQSFAWYKINSTVSPATDELIPQSVVSDTMLSSITNLEEGVYRLNWGSNNKYIYVLDFKNTSYSISDFKALEADNALDFDPCSNVLLRTLIKQEDIFVYDYVNDNSALVTPEIKYTWYNRKKASSDWVIINAEPLNNNQKLSTAPFDDMEYKSTVSADFFGSKVLMGQRDSIISYEAIAVKIDGVEGEINERDNDNEVDKSEDGADLRGSSPLNVTLKPKNKTEKAYYFEWEIWKDQGENPVIIKYSTEEVRHTFIDPLDKKQSDQTADYYAKLTVSSERCEYSDSTEIYLIDSYLRASNIFVIGFGVNLDYKCEYKSILPGSFKGVIINRWGRTVHKWTNPQLGWDGRVGGSFVSPGPYRIVLEAQGTDGRKLKYRSDLTILREK